MKGLEELFVIGWMLFGIYIEVFIMILADLWSGVRKAKVRGETVEGEASCLRAAYKVVNDPDGYEGMIFWT